VFDSWKQWEGQTVDSAFPLLRYLGGSQRGGVFFTERRDHGRTVPAAIKLVLSSSEKAVLRLSRWQQAARLSHPQLLRLYETGRSELSAVPFVYVVMQIADENLGQVLAERALTPEEARAMLPGLLDVLRYLHSKGFVHGHLKPSNLLAIGDQLKISSDRVCRAGEPLENPSDPDEYDPPEHARGIIPVSERASREADIWSLGVTLVEALTGNRPVPLAAGQNVVVPANLPEPFAEIARHCLRPGPLDRWTIAQVADCLAGGKPTALSPAPAPAPAPVPAPAPRVRADAAAPAAAPSEPADKRHGSRVLAAVAVLVVAIVAAVGWMRYQSSSAESTAAQIASTAGVSNPVAPEAPPATPPPPAASAGQSRQNIASSASPRASARIAETKPAPAPPLEPNRPNRAKPLREAVDSGVIRGDVARQVMPQVAHSALDTIQGTVRVRIKLQVDPSGGVTDAQFESQGPSKYFARAAMQAAQDWKFKPPEAGGRQVASTWQLRFEFDRDGAKAVPTQTAP